MIEKLIEANIVSQVEALNLDRLDVTGLWQPAAVGCVKGEELSSAPAALAVRVSPRAFRVNSISEITMDVVLALVIRTDLCPTGAEIESYAAPIAALCQHWNLALHAGVADDCGFDVEGFLPGGIHFAGGTPPAYNRETATWAVAFNLVIHGNVTNS